MQRRNYTAQVLAGGIGSAAKVSWASNDEVERREVAPATNEDALSQSSTPSLAHRRCDPRDRSNC